MNEKKNLNPALSNADKVSPGADEELAFIEYQEKVTRSKNEKRNRRILIALSVAAYLLGLGIFASIVTTVYNMNNTAGYIVGAVLLAVYTICFIVVIAEIYSKHSFDIEAKKSEEGKISERKNNKVRFEIARNIAEQSKILDYLEKQYKKEVLSAREGEELQAFNKVISISLKYGSDVPSNHSEDAQDLAGALTVTFRKDGIIYKKAKSMILARATETGCLTALSQNAAVDAGVVVVKNMQLIKDLIYLYGFRPGDYQMNQITMKVIRAVCVSLGLNTFSQNANWAGKVFNKDSNNFLVQMLGQVINMGAQFLGNGAMTYLIGKYTVNVLLQEYRIQDLLRLKDLSDYRMELSNQTIHDLNETIEVEVKELSNKPGMSEEYTTEQEKLLLENPEKKTKHLFFDVFHWFDRKDKIEAEKPAEEDEKKDGDGK